MDSRHVAGILILCKLQSILTQTSHNIFNFTNGRVQLRDVRLQLPSSWDHCPPTGRTFSSSSSSQEADIKIISSHPVLKEQPWTVQFAGCQQPGKNIELPLGFIGKNLTIESKSSVLTKEWIKLRFGVFEEEGFDGDNLYPSSFVEGNSNMSNNGCPSKHQVCCTYWGWEIIFCLNLTKLSQMKYS